MPATRDEIPYEAQTGPLSCGAAALCMVYRSLGYPCDQAGVHAAVTRHGPGGQRVAFTHLLAGDALKRGLGALIVQARSPWRLLQRCADSHVRAVLNHRLTDDNPAGHYSVLVGVGEEQVTLHDPLNGPGRVLPKGDFLRLWSPSWPSPSVVGHVLLAIGDPAEAPVCRHCAAAPPANCRCRWCRASVPLRPGVVLGCAAEGCPARLWHHCYCPWCDHSFSTLAEARDGAV
jgi:hypothetical protein